MLVDTIKKEHRNPESIITEIDRFDGYIPVAEKYREESQDRLNQLPEYFNGKKILTSSINEGETNKERSIRRAKKAVKTLCYLNVCRDWKFLTLTYAGEGQFSEKQVRKDIKDFIARLEKGIKRDIKYIGTTEYHESGHGLHVHLLCNLPYMENNMLAKKYWKKGFIKINALNIEKKKRGLLNVIGYLTKYITKEMAEHGLGKHHYLRSRNLHEEVTAVRMTMSDEQFEEYKKRLMRAGHEYVEEFTVEVAPGINMTRFIFIKKIYTENKTEKKVDKTG